MKGAISMAIGLVTLMAVPFYGMAQEQQGAGQGPPRGAPPLTVFDQDGDGKVSEDEWVEHQRERFGEIDTDGDGFLSETELKAHQPSMGRGPGGPRGRP